MRALRYGLSAGRSPSWTPPDPTPGPGPRLSKWPDRSVPQRLARLARPRQRHGAALHPRARVHRHGDRGTGSARVARRQARGRALRDGLRHCPECTRGHGQVCRAQRQPGFTDQGSFAAYVPVVAARVNLVALPDAIGGDAAAALGCRYATAWRALTASHRCRRANAWPCSAPAVSASPRSRSRSISAPLRCSPWTSRQPR